MMNSLNEMKKLFIIIVSLLLFFVVSSSTAMAGWSNFSTFSAYVYCKNADPGEDPHIHIGQDPYPSFEPIETQDGINHGGGGADILFEKTASKNRENKDIHIHVRFDRRINLLTLIMLLI